ncbi:hypothetical protein BS78_06G233200 [Paspalum vaginatum]|nr:hypothetical protein BS78_06G233200 [Paspalum vaginatum]
MVTVIMAKAQLIAGFAIEVAPSQLSSIIRRRGAVPRTMLDTIAEEDKEPAVELSSYALLLRTSKAPRQNLSHTAAADTEAAGMLSSSVVHGECVRN